MHESTLDFIDGVFVFRCAFENREMAKRAGFQFDAERKSFITKNLRNANRLREFANDRAKNKISDAFLTITPWAGRVPHPDHLKPKPYQMEAVRFAIERNRSYLALDPGLGKTIVAALISNARKGAFVAYVCPPFLVPNVRSEFETWSGFVPHFMPDSMLPKLQVPMTTGVERILFVDEAHRFKNPDSLRSRELYLKIMPRFDRVVFMSGTPMPNRPAELYPVLHYAAPETIDFKTWREYAMHYCAAYWDGFQLNTNGASNVEELSRNVVGKFMHRVKKSVLNLPPKLEEMVVIGDAAPVEIAKIERVLLQKYSPSDLMRGVISDKDIPLATYRRKLGALKAKHSMKYIESVLDETEDDVILIAIHKDVVSLLARELSSYEPLVISGDVPSSARYAIARKFMSSKKHRVVILNPQAGGVGFNLTKANRVVVVVFSWCPAENDQAADRAHRFGQGQTVLVQYLLFKNSVDRIVMDTVLRKKTSIDKL